MFIMLLLIFFLEIQEMAKLSYTGIVLLMFTK